MTDQHSKNVVAEYIAQKCLYLPHTGTMHGKGPGVRYSSQFYLARALYDPVILQLICENFMDEVYKIYPDNKFQIAGREWSSIPLLTAIPMYYKMNDDIDINAFMVRKERKTYGKNNIIEGSYNNYPVIAVDDLCNSTNSFLHTRRICDTLHIPVSDYIYAVLNKATKEEQTGFDNIDTYAKTLYMVDLDDIRRHSI